jgi:hypothetical protein
MRRLKFVTQIRADLRRCASSQLLDAYPLGNFIVKPCSDISIRLDSNGAAVTDVVVPDPPTADFTFPAGRAYTV